MMAKQRLVSATKCSFFLTAFLLLRVAISFSKGDETNQVRRLGLEDDDQRDITETSSLGLLLEQSPQQSTTTNAAASTKGAILQYVPLFCIDSSRCEKLDMNQRFSFIHISKTGGTSWIREFKTLLKDFFPQEDQGVEYSVAYQNSLDPFDFLSYHLISLRSPRLHSWSLFTECKYDVWGKTMTNGTDFPRSGTTPKDDVHDFRIWLNHFLGDDASTSTRQPRRTSDCFGCYYAANYQTNALTSTVHKPGHKNDTMAALEPDIGRSVQVYESMDWVALTDFFHESKCLFYHRLEPKTAPIDAYLRDMCRCGIQSSSGSSSKEGVKQDVHATHHDNGHRSSILDLPIDILESIDALTRVDQQLYTVALQRFVQEIVWLETELGQQVLCDNVLEQWEPELAYLDISLTSIYTDAKSAFTNE
jgi:hypothetical protein